jgi:predicted GIY-YIG superfamily endonuclease
MPFFVYFIESTSGSTYIGATVDVDKRIRQHNKEIKGGATATSIKVLKGELWSYACYVENFPTWKAALQFEWRWKQISRQLQKTTPNLKPYEKRMQALIKLLNLEQPTSKAELYSSWLEKPNIIFNDKKSEQYYNCQKIL